MTQHILQTENIKVAYSGLPVLHGVSLNVDPGETVCVVGASGAGKSTLLRAIMGTQHVFEGRILFEGHEFQQLKTEQIVKMGITCVPEEKMLFRPLSVEENLRLGGYVLNDEEKILENLEFVHNLFPKLKERRAQAATTLSGDEQQMVAMVAG